MTDLNGDIGSSAASVPPADDPFVTELSSALPDAGDDIERDMQAAALYHAGRRDWEACGATLGLLATGPIYGDYRQARVLVARQHRLVRRCRVARYADALAAFRRLETDRAIVLRRSLGWTLACVPEAERPERVPGAETLS